MSSALVERPSVSASDCPASASAGSRAFLLKRNLLAGPERDIFDRHRGLYMLRDVKSKTFTRHSTAPKVPYSNERVTTPQVPASGDGGAAFRIQGVTAFRMLPNVDVAGRWIPEGRAPLAAIRLRSTRFNVTAVKPVA